MLLLPVVRLMPAFEPKAMLFDPVLLARLKTLGRVAAAGGVEKERIQYRNYKS